MKIEINIEALARALGIENVAAFTTGINDGKEQGVVLSMGMTYDNDVNQWAYDIGTHLGACVAVRPGQGGKWSGFHTNVFNAIKETADSNGTPEDYQTALSLLTESAVWPIFAKANYQAALLESIYTATGIIVKAHPETDIYKAGYEAPKQTGASTILNYPYRSDEGENADFNGVCIIGPDGSKSYGELAGATAEFTNRVFVALNSHDKLVDMLENMMLCFERSDMDSMANAANDVTAFFALEKKA